MVFLVIAETETALSDISVTFSSDESAFPYSSYYFYYY